jgi:hypothetical protein
MWFENSSRELPHPRHHWCGSWGSRLFAQVSAEVDMLADCGCSDRPCCRHVDISTSVHTDRRLSTCCPLVPPVPVPRSCARRRRRRRDPTGPRGTTARPAARPGGGPGRHGAHTTRSATCGRRGGGQGATALPRRGVTTREVVGTRYPQTVHIPGDNSSTSRPQAGRPARLSPDEARHDAMHTVAHRCGEVDSLHRRPTGRHRSGPSSSGCPGPPRRPASPSTEASRATGGRGS